MDNFLRLSPVEQVAAFPSELKTGRGHIPAPRAESPRKALERTVANVIADSPVYVLFSGGRDSSAVLALAIRMARLTGAADPLPVTIQHVNAPLSDEAEWQEIVLKHLGVKERLVLTFNGEQSLLGNAATTSLREFGLLWPPSLQVQRAVYSKLAPGTVLTGEGGDLIIDQRRITSLATAMRRTWIRTSLREAKSLVGDSFRKAQHIDNLVARSPWLTENGRRRVREEIWASREPLRWNNALRVIATSRPALVGRRNFEEVVKAHGHAIVNPFENADFISALEGAGGMLGLGSRTEMMRYLFHDLLPDVVLSRPTKAAFNETRWMEPEREFAEHWSGKGVDHDSIDAGALQQEWLKARPSTLSGLSLHAAWLAANSLPLVPHAS
ncbi:asparagine synthase (glutamine-hydrolysing) [Paramicrobacterium humi]|uniref:Asparagine synthase (Glutamine-hydrolysing) n=1 Tax=Paramicrobacterium humi TaxID=640635 RepID=A0A1H4MNL5_9MICO|nr:asparagine synthase-related protein [Microbacterium humi]SEB84364.1 asparagine synthase (glutamine-hydrolysing) [Microbacterium humi]